MDDEFRRRSVGPPAARSMLITILGEYVGSDDTEVWQETLIGALATMDYKVPAARRALARSIIGGWLSAERHGRRSRVRLTAETAATLRDGRPHIYEFGRPWSWAGEWLLVVVRVPEEHRELRDAVRNKLWWAGFGSLGNGVWITPHVEREAQLRSLADEAETAHVLTFRAALSEIGDPANVVAEAWDLDGIAEAYRAFVDRFETRTADTAQAAFRGLTELLQEWRRFPFLDPDLPAEMLPADWPRAAARALFDRHLTAWREPAHAFFASLEDAEAAGTLSVGAGSPA